MHMLVGMYHCVRSQLQLQLRCNLCSSFVHDFWVALPSSQSDSYSCLPMSYSNVILRPGKDVKYEQ